MPACCESATLLPNHSSLVMFTSMRAPCRTSSRARSGKIASKHTRHENGPPGPENSTGSSPGVHSAWPSSILPSIGSQR